MGKSKETVKRWRRDRQAKLLLSEPCPVCDQLVAAWLLQRFRPVVDEDLTQRPCLSFPQPPPNVRFHAEQDILVPFSLPRFIGTPTQCSSSTLTGYTRYIAQHTAIRYCFSCPWFEVELRQDDDWCGPRFCSHHLPFRGDYGFFRSIDFACHYCLLPWQSAVGGWRLVKSCIKKYVEISGQKENSDR